jgi:arylsulfatase A-like enzyme
MATIGRVCWLLASVVATAGCTCQESQSEPAPDEIRPAASSSAPSPPAPVSSAGDYDLVENLDVCEIRHQGLSIDLGTTGPGARRSFTIVPPDQVETIDRGGASFERVQSKRTRLDFWLDEARPAGTRISVRVHGQGARRLTAYIDDKRLGTAKLTRDETTVVELPPARFELASGRHTLTLRFWNVRSGPREPLADLDWIRIGSAEERNTTYAAPTRRDVLADFELGGRPKRSIVLRASSSLRCSMQPTQNSELRVALGYWGNGRGDVEVRIVQDGEPPVTMQQRKITGGKSAKWIPLRIDLSTYAGQLIGLELRVLEATGGGRVAFGEPVVAKRKPSDVTIPEARVVVLVIAAGLDRRRVPPWGPIGGLTALGELARAGVAFTRYRVPTTVPAGVVASLLTGLPPQAHMVNDRAARLPRTVRTIADIAKDASARTAFFTGAPTTFPAFGFDSGWDRLEVFSPVQDVAAAEPYRRAAEWLEHELAEDGASRLLLVVHARGGHPPWDLSKDEAGRLPPEEYGGVLDPRRGGIVLGKLRARRRRAQRRLAEEDWTRLRALQDAAVVKQDAALGQLVAALKRSGVWEQSLVVFTGDVAAGDPPELPYDPDGALRESRLLVPLVVKFPGPRRLTHESTDPVSSEDVAYTILRALRLGAPARPWAAELFRSACGQHPAVERVQVAAFGPHYSSRLGTWLLSGEFGKLPKLCGLDVDPACAVDVYADNPIAAQATWRWTYRAEVAARSALRPPAEREPASLDTDTTAALTVWGSLE